MMPTTVETTSIEKSWKKLCGKVVAEDEKAGAKKPSDKVGKVER